MAQVKVYWNLHKNVFSIQYKGTVIAHAKGVELAGVKFKVSEAGRQRVLLEKRKNVHAFVCADTIVAGYGLQATGNGDDSPLEDVEYRNQAACVYFDDDRQAYYNPYQVQSFVDRLTRKPLTKAKRATLYNRSVSYVA